MPANPLFSLSRLTDSGTAPGSSSEDVTGAHGSSSGDDGYESDSDSSYYGSDFELDKVNCQLCRQPLSRKPRRGLLGRRRKAHGSSHFMVCDCCQRAYHEDCCRERKISTKEAKDGTWYHSSSCKECQEGLQQQASKGPIALPEGRSWQLIDCSPVSPSSGLAGSSALSALKRSLGGVLEVLLPAYGPGVAQQLVDTSKGYAVLLSQQARPVTAGLLDVYGQECAVLDLVATQMAEQGKGHCCAMLQALEGWLGPQLGVASLIAVCPADEPESIRAWQHKFGFTQVKQQHLRQLLADVPPLNYYEESVLLSKQLPKQQQQQQQQQQPQELLPQQEVPEGAAARPS
ncbi:hypothetical protein COO60DRAFT_473197 [Scenedesmus sp. NREL 46B-D3]|nr:hypothetical protein COO60DRAFT_473197 [Scenedesmus sp. NREL 46B-D3]